jgi:hypothetical protein
MGIPLPSPGQILRVALQGAGDIYPWANILHWAYTGATPSVATLDTIADDIAGAWETDMASIYTVDNSLITTKVTDLSSAFGAQVERDTGVTGTNGEDPIPNNVCTLITFPVALRYRGGHPRTYLAAGGAGNQATDSVTEWNSGYITEVTTAWANFTDAVSVLSVGGCDLGDLVCVRYFSEGALLTDPIVLTLPTFEVSNRVASQRRRVGRENPAMAKPIVRSASKEYADQLAKLKAIKRSGKGVTTTRPAPSAAAPVDPRKATAEVDQSGAADVSSDPPFKKVSSRKAD